MESRRVLVGWPTSAAAGRTGRGSGGPYACAGGFPACHHSPPGCVTALEGGWVGSRSGRPLPLPSVRWRPLLAFPQRRLPGARGQVSGLFRPVFPKRKFFSPGDTRIWAPGGHPIFPDFTVAPLRFELHADGDGRRPAPFPHHRPPFGQQFPVMLLCRCQGPFPSAVPLVGEERGMGFAPALQPHEKTVSAFGGLVNPADARSSRRSAHKSWLGVLSKMAGSKASSWRWYRPDAS